MTGDIVDIILKSLLWIMGAGLAGIIVIMLIVLRKFNVKFIQKKLASDGMKVIKIRKAKFDTKKNYTKLLGFVPNKAPLPPDDCIEVMDNGKLCVTAYLTATGQFIYGRDESVLKEVPKDILDIKNIKDKETKIKTWQNENNVFAYKPVTSNQRTFLANEIAKADAEKSFWQKNGLTVVGIGALVIIVVFGFIGLAEFLDYNKERMQHEQVMMEKFGEITEQLSSNLQGIQTFKQKQPPN